MTPAEKTAVSKLKTTISDQKKEISSLKADKKKLEFSVNSKGKTIEKNEAKITSLAEEKYSLSISCNKLEDKVTALESSGLNTSDKKDAVMKAVYANPTSNSRLSLLRTDLFQEQKSRGKIDEKVAVDSILRMAEAGINDFNKNKDSDQQMELSKINIQEVAKAVYDDLVKAFGTEE